MEGGCGKTGYLLKSGPHMFQPWRKRWFVLSNDNIKYYNSDVVNDSNLLGTIQMVDVQSVKQSKEKKHSFEVNTRGRTYNMQAKTDMLRDDWVIAIRNASTNQRQLSDTNIYAEIGPGSTAVNNPPVGVYAQVQLDPKSNTSVPNETHKNNDYEIPTATGGKVRAQSLVPLKDEESSSRKKKMPVRSLSEGMMPQKGRAGCLHGILHDMSIDEEPEEDMVALYQQIDATLDRGYTTEDDDNEEEEEDVQFCLPEPLDGNATYAFDEIKQLVEKSGEITMDVDLDTIAKSCNLSFVDENGEYPAISLLTAYLKGTSLTLEL